MGNKVKLGAFESELLHFVSSSGPSTVGFMYREFGKQKGLVRGTIVKTVDRMFRKGALTRCKVGSKYEYTASLDPKSVEIDAVSQFVEERLRGRIAPIASFLLRRHDLSDDARKELELLLKNESEQEGES